jgi:hypothetical protein
MQQLTKIIYYQDTSINLLRHLQQFFQNRDELIHHNGLIFKEQRIVIPENLRGDIIQRLHHSHCGMEATLRLAQETVYWPNITDHIRNKIGNCHICISNSVSKRKEQMLSVQPLNYASPKPQSRPNASISTSAHENQIIQTSPNSPIVHPPAKPLQYQHKIHLRILITGCIV